MNAPTRIGGRLWHAAGILIVPLFLFELAPGASHSLRWRLFPTLLSRTVGFEAPENKNRAEGFLWSRLEARIRLPLLVRAGATVGLEVSSPAGPRRVGIALGPSTSQEVAIDGATPARTAVIAGPEGWRPVEVELKVVPLNDRRRGVRVHALTLEHGRWALLPAPRALLALAFGLAGLAVVLGLSGFSARQGALIAAASVGAPVCLLTLFDPLAGAIVVLRLAPWLPPLVALCTLMLRLCARFLPADTLAPAARRTVLILFLLSLILRGGFALHPAQYHQDVPIHTKIASIALERGLGDLWRHIDEYGLEHDLGRTNVHGGLPVIRYPPTFFTLTQLPNLIQRSLTGENSFDYWNRLLASVANAFGIIPVFLIARRLAPTLPAAALCATLDLLSPVDFHELAGVSFPAVLGKLPDLAFLCALLWAGAQARFWLLALGLSLCLMTYAGSWVSWGVLFALSIFFLALRREWRQVGMTVGAGLSAVVVSHLLFYRTMIVDAVTVHLGAGLAAQDGEGGFARLLDVRRWFWGEYGIYFSLLHLALFAWGLLAAARVALDPVARSWLRSWQTAFLLLLVLQAVGGSVLVYYRGLFLTAPLVAILCGLAIADAWRRGRVGWRWAACCLVVSLVALQVSKIVGMVPAFMIRYDGRLPLP